MESRGRAHIALPGAESFATAWVAACGNFAPPRKLTFAELHEWAFARPFVVRFRGGRYLGVSRKPDVSALLRVMARFDRLSSSRAQEGW